MGLNINLEKLKRLLNLEAAGYGQDKMSEILEKIKKDGIIFSIEIIQQNNGEFEIVREDKVRDILL